MILLHVVPPSKSNYGIRLHRSWPLGASDLDLEFEALEEVLGFHLNIRNPKPSTLVPSSSALIPVTLFLWVF